MKLEDFRNQQIMGEVAIHNPYFNGQPLPFLFHDTATAAFLMTKDALHNMQLQEFIGANGFCLPGVGLWFQATESYISTIYKLAVAESAHTGRSIQTVRKVEEKLIQINQYFSLSISASTKNRLQEFAAFRNGIFHDLTLVRNTTYSHTVFSARPEKLNEVDLIQAARVAIDIFVTYRYLIKGVDLMPQVWIGNQYADLDSLADEVLYPAFTEILSLKGLSTQVDLSSRYSRCNPEDYDLKIAVMISNAGPKYPHVGDGAIPSMVSKHFQQACDARPLDQTKFGFPGYMRTHTAPPSNTP